MSVACFLITFSSVSIVLLFNSIFMNEEALEVLLQRLSSAGLLSHHQRQLECFSMLGSTLCSDPLFL
jgi:hypothetical protein